MTLLESLRGSVQELFGEEDDPDEAIRQLYIGQKDGCVPDDYIGDDLGRAIYRKFYSMGDAIRKLVAVAPDDLVEIHIEADYVDMTWMAFICEDQILLLWQCKPWNFCWSSVDAMFEWMCKQHRTLQERYHIRRGIATDCGSGDWCVIM